MSSRELFFYLTKFVFYVIYKKDQNNGLVMKRTLAKSEGLHEAVLSALEKLENCGGYFRVQRRTRDAAGRVINETRSASYHGFLMNDRGFTIYGVAFERIIEFNSVTSYYYNSDNELELVMMSESAMTELKIQIRWNQDQD